ncbi:hypothetical protein GCM10018779_09860 [Streptomyces griseocarneus]|nr:hypothetical protein GCM10018779_09860 [Streptomyces griseocarneus]
MNPEVGLEVNPVEVFPGEPEGKRKFCKNARNSDGVANSTDYGKSGTKIHLIPADLWAVLRPLVFASMSADLHIPVSSAATWRSHTDPTPRA